MIAKFERRHFSDSCHVWVGKYRGLNNVPHWHLENELIVCGGGSASVSLDDETCSIGAGECIFCEGETVHHIVSGPDSYLLVAQYDASLSPGTAQVRPLYARFPDSCGAFERMNRIYREEQDEKPFYAEKMNADMAGLIVDLLRAQEVTQVHSKKVRFLDRYKNLLVMIEQSCDEITFHDAAAYMNMSEAYFSRFFKRTSGMTFSEYLNAARIARAVEILAAEPDITMTALMARSGFNTLRNFNRVFKEVTGYAPSRLPENYVLHFRSLTEQEFFDPTLGESELLR